MAGRGARVRLDQGINMADPPSELAQGELTIARNSMYMPESNYLAKAHGRSIAAAIGSRVTGLTWCKFKDGSAFLLASAADQYLTAPATSSSTFTARATSLSSVGRMEAVYFNGVDRAYLSDGVNAMRAWDGSGNMRLAGLTAPATATLTELVNAQTVYPRTSTFSYCHTEVDDATDSNVTIESGPSPVVVTALVTDGSTFKYALPAVTNASTNKIRVYRTQHGGNIFYQIAEFASTNVRYYDGDDTEGLGNSIDNDTEWGFKSVDDIFLSTQRVLPMLGSPLAANYMTVNGTIPIGDIMVPFQNAICIAGVDDFPQHLYYSMPDEPEIFPPVNFIPVENGFGDPITGMGTASDRLIIFTTNTIYRMNTLPGPTDPGFGLGLTTREEITRDHGCVAKRSVVNFGVGEPSNRLFYLSSRGPMMTDGEETWPLNADLGWSEKLVNFGAISGAVAVNYPKYQQVWLWVPSPESRTNDVAWIYHYHPNHIKTPPVGKWTGPIHARCAAATVAFEPDSETRMFIADTNDSGNVYLEDNGFSDAQEYDDEDGAIDWEWETGDDPLGEESAKKRVQRIFVSVMGTDSFAPTFTVAVNKRDQTLPIRLQNQSNNTVTSRVLGTSSTEKVKTRSYRGGVWKSGSHFRFRMQETAIADRTITSIEPELESFGRQK